MLSRVIVEVSGFPDGSFGSVAVAASFRYYVVAIRIPLKVRPSPLVGRRTA